VFRKLTLLALILALFVVVLGAYVRLSDAGLGCPDWPGCYGNLVIQEHPEAVDQANQAYPERPFNAGKAWKEMIHRYFASGLGFLIIILNVMAWRHREKRVRGLAGFLLLLVMFQGALGMWTVTLLVKPAVVVSHLLGGFATLGLLFWLYLRLADTRGIQKVFSSRPLVWGARVGLLLLVMQIALGGWTSTNYAALACPGLPTCYGTSDYWPPDLDYASGFVLWRGLGVDYEGGVLDLDARAAIHWVHRIAAVVVSAWLLLLSLALMRQRYTLAALFVAMSLMLQFGLGVANIHWQLPLPLAVAHNGGAALLLLAILYANFMLRPRQQRHVSELGLS